MGVLLKTIGCRAKPFPRLSVALGILSVSTVVAITVSVEAWFRRPAAGLSWDQKQRASSAADAARNRPLVVPPRIHRLITVPTVDFKKLDDEIQPCKREALTLSTCLHLLRVSGLDGKFDNNQTLRDSHEVLELVTDAKKGELFLGQAPLIRTREGLRYPTGASHRWTEPHRDQSLACLAELRIPLSFPLIAGAVRLTLREVLRDSVANFHLQQKELAWTAIAYALYLPPTHDWANRYAEVYSFDQLTNEILSRSLEIGSCGAIHNIYALTIIARADASEPVLSLGVRVRLWNYLKRILTVAVQTQQRDGCWLPSWFQELLPEGRPEDFTPAESFDNKLLMTGHLAEWMLYLPTSLDVPEAVLVRAGGWLQEAIKNATPRDKEALVCPYTHAVRFLKHVVTKEGVPAP